ncbi:hypothetical protein [Agrobacterium tumefaciens]|uniref:hypothetical protein n=1 Tax=Agrobacterium tumefaciens TaxID=358 RepID=UPI00101A529C|nr:hypothetical protein [Agrobacterium tumefaciens]UXS04508.1 hypothetical protein FY156_23900 [Agrobacterium tumefaciens]
MRLVFTSIVFLCAGAAIAQEPATNFAGTYYCKISAAAGLKQNPSTKTWEGTRFNVQDEAYKVVVTDINETHQTQHYGNWRVYKIKINEFGAAPNKLGCAGRVQVDPNDREKIAISDYGATECYFFGTVYSLDFKTNLFQVMFEGGYMDPDKQNTDTPYIAVGKCDKIG